MRPIGKDKLGNVCVRCSAHTLALFLQCHEPLAERKLVHRIAMKQKHPELLARSGGRQVEANKRRRSDREDMHPAMNGDAFEYAEAPSSMHQHLLCPICLYVQCTDAVLRCMSLCSSSRVSMRSAAPAFGPHWMRPPGCPTVLTAAHRWATRSLGMHRHFSTLW